jgi:hypothetical protein
VKKSAEKTPVKTGAYHFFEIIFVPAEDIFPKIGLFLRIGVR